MDNQHYHSASYLPYSSNQHQHYASLGSLSAPHQQQPQQQQQESPADAPTLPPLQSQNGTFAHLPSLYSNASHPNTPTAPHTPTTGSMPSSNPHAYSQYSSPVTSGSMPPPTSYGHPLGGSFAGSQSMMPSTTTATSASSVLAGTSAQNRLPDLRPMPQVSYSGSLSSLSGFPSSSLLSQQQYLPQAQEAEPTHVVGSQGRRGILPSAPGRAAPPTPGTAASTKSMIPAKDADGKFPCPHCTKTYLHAKHLKRHLLRRGSILCTLTSTR